jgi:hypothetical protein
MKNIDIFLDKLLDDSEGGELNKALISFFKKKVDDGLSKDDLLNKLSNIDNATEWITNEIKSECHDKANIAANLLIKYTEAQIKKSLLSLIPNGLLIAYSVFEFALMVLF